MRTDLYRDPKVIRIAELLEEEEGLLAQYVNQNTQCNMRVTRNVTRNATVGSLLSIWGLVRHRGKRKRDDLIIKCTLEIVDQITEMPGFGDAMRQVGWIIKDGENLIFPNYYSEMNTEPGAQTNAERQRRYREKKRNESNEKRNESNVTRNVTRNVTSNAEKRREEKSIYIEGETCVSPTPHKDLEPEKPKTKTTKRGNGTAFDKNKSITREQYQAILADPDLAAGDREWLKRQVETMADHFVGKLKKDWAATLRNWCRKSRYDFGSGPNGTKPSDKPPRAPVKNITEAESRAHLLKMEKLTGIKLT